MEREKKIMQTKRRIMDSALQEFSEQGYGASSINAICASHGLSKGIIYHYFSTKDTLFLACVEECFSLLAQYLDEKMQTAAGDTEQKLEIYFAARMEFFAKYPVYQRIFCEAVITPPALLRQKIQEKRKNFDLLNIHILERLLEPVPLRPEVTRKEVIDTLRQFQDFINAQYQISELSVPNFAAHERICRRALNILLYGVIERKE